MTVSRPQAPVVFTRDVPPHASSLAHGNTGPSTALYSDIVASRPPSPRKENEKEAPETGSVKNDLLDCGVLIGNSTSPNKVDTTSLEEGETPEIEEDKSNWTTVRGRHAQSLSSLNSAQINEKQYGLKGKLTTEQVKMVHAASLGMTEQQKDMLHRRQKKMLDKRSSSISSRGEGPSKLKGKNIDPRE